MKPIEVGHTAVAWTRASLQWLDRRRGQPAVRLGPAAAGRLRTWLASVAAATAAGVVAAVTLHLLVRAALRASDGLGWLAVVATAAIAVTLLVMVLRTTVISVVVRQRRRTHLVAFLLSIAAILAAVQAGAAATVMLSGRSSDLWQTEQLYAWKAADAVPLLAIPERLHWMRPDIASSAGDRGVLVAFTVAVAVPLAGAVVALYHLTGTAAVRLRFPQARIAVPVVAAAGFLWGGLGSQTPSGLGVAVALLGAAVLAGVVGALQRLWKPIAHGPWMQLALAAGLVWIDTPIRRLLLPNGGDLAAPWKFLVMLGLWAVLTILLLPVWVDPHLPETLLALMLLLAFAAADGPGNADVAALFGWTAGGVAVGPAVAAAMACVTGAFLVYLVSQAPGRAANDDGVPVGGSMDLRRELLGFVYIGLQLVIAAAGTLMLLRGLGVISASSVDAPRSLAAVAWQVADSVPGGLPAAAGWRPDTEFTGSWAGAVIVVTVAALVVFAVFPSIRAVAQWARERAAPPPLGDVPEQLGAHLAVVRAFLVGSTVETIDPARAEQHLAAAWADLRRLRDLVGAESPLYWSADQAVAQSLDAYRKVVSAQVPLQWSMWPDRASSVSDATAAIDMYADAAVNWQMGPEVVAEIEYRLHDLEVREDGVQQREGDVTTRERAAQERDQFLRRQESESRTREHQLSVREREAERREVTVGARELGVQTREQTVDARESSVAVRETDAAWREEEIRTGTQRNDERERSVEARERTATSRETDVDRREHWVQAREQNADLRYEAVVAREREAAERDATG